MGEFERCRRCGRKLWSAKSQEIGYGRFCLRKVQKAVDQLGAKEVQVNRALDLIESDGIVEVVSKRFKNRLFRVVASSGNELYTTTVDVCTCPAGRAERLCYHRVAVTMVIA